VSTEDELLVRHCGHILCRGFDRLHVAIIKITVGVREMSGCGVKAIGQQNFEIRAVLLMLANLRDVDTIESDVTRIE